MPSLSRYRIYQIFDRPRRRVVVVRVSVKETQKTPRREIEKWMKNPYEDHTGRGRASGRRRKYAIDEDP
jgi:hypothetical protein